MLSHPEGLPTLQRPARGRPPNYIPLLVAIDEICRRGISTDDNESDGFARPSPLKRGRRSADRAIPESDVLLVALANDWDLGPETVYEYLRDGKRFYYPRAVALVNTLLRFPISPPLRLDEIRRAASEYQRRYALIERLPLAPGGIEFALHPLVYEPKQRSSPTKSRSSPRQQKKGTNKKERPRSKK
jgi:hypothetical protein